MTIENKNVIKYNNNNNSYNLNSENNNDYLNVYSYNYNDDNKTDYSDCYWIDDYNYNCYINCRNKENRNNY